MRKLAIFIGSLFMGMASLMATPAQIIVIRHGEKPADPSAVDLAPAGEKRAKELVAYIKTNPELIRFGLPVALFATETTKSGKGLRTTQTLEPLSRDLKLPIQTPYKKELNHKLADTILADHKFDGKTVLICWTHEFIPELIEALGIHPPPTKLKETDYDRVYVISYKDGAAKLHESKQ